MSENDHPKVIVDDDFLDLRNPQIKTFSRRPTSSRSKTKDSSSTNTQGKVGTPREVLPGLQRLLNTYNQKNINTFRSKRCGEEKNVQIDSRFRRKVEKKALSTRSASILQEKAKLVKGNNARSNSSEVTESTVSSTSEKKSEIMPEKQLSRSVENPSARPPTNEPTVMNTQSSRPCESETSLILKDEIEDEIISSRDKKRVKDDEDPSAENKTLNDRNEKLCRRSSTPIKKKNDKFQDLHTAEMCKNDEYKTSAEASSSATRRRKDKFDKLLDEEKFKNEKLFDIEETPSRNKYSKPNSRGVIKDLAQDCSVISNKLQQLKWYDPTLLLPNSLHSIPSFRRSWTIPSFPLIKRDVFWGRHYNVLCEKEDRKTYKFDSDDTISLESLQKPSSHSSRFRNNYMNLIFCLGCMCGIFLVAGILTASEIQANFYKPDETKLAFFEFIFKEIMYTFEVIFDGFLQVLTFPKTFFKPKETPKSWVLF